MHLACLDRKLVSPWVRSPPSSSSSPSSRCWSSVACDDLTIQKTMFLHCARRRSSNSVRPSCLHAEAPGGEAATNFWRSDALQSKSYVKMRWSSCRIGRFPLYMRCILRLDCKDTIQFPRFSPGEYVSAVLGYRACDLSSTSMQHRGYESEGSRPKLECPASSTSALARRSARAPNRALLLQAYNEKSSACPLDGKFTGRGLGSPKVEKTAWGHQTSRRSKQGVLYTYRRYNYYLVVEIQS